MEPLVHEVAELKRQVVVVVVQVDVDDSLRLYIEHERHLHSLLLVDLVEHEVLDHEIHESLEVHEQQVNQ